MSSREVQRPLVSIITVVRNAETVIEETLSSICRLKADDIEYIVIDGKSTDRTLAIIDNYSSCIDILVSESDKGIYDAMNKAASRARGTYLLHLNAGDSLLRIPRAELSAADGGAAIVSFPVKLSSGGVFEPRSGFLLSICNTLHHQGNFYRLSLVSPYDLKYRTFADFDLNQRLAPAIQTYAGTEPIAFHSEDGLSHDRKRFNEVFSIVLNNKGAGHVAMTWLYFKFRGLRWRLRSVFPFAS